MCDRLLLDVYSIVIIVMLFDYIYMKKDNIIIVNHILFKQFVIYSFFKEIVFRNFSDIHYYYLHCCDTDSVF